MPASHTSGHSAEPVVTLYRPVGLRELALLFDSGLRQFPPRLPAQPYFYPVCNFEYAKQIAADWNIKDEASVFSGFVTRFAVRNSFLSRFNPRTVGSSVHQEYWIPAEKMDEFNRNIEGRISVDAAFFGSAFQGYVPGKSILKGKKAVDQFVELAKLWDYSAIEFGKEVSLNRKAIYLNNWFWAQHDFKNVGIPFEQKLLLFERLRNSWELAQIETPWPTESINELLYASANPRDDGPGRFQNARSRAGGSVNNVVCEEAIDAQDEFHQQVKKNERKRPPVVTAVSVGLFLYAAFFLTLVIIGFARPELWKTGDIKRDSDIVFHLSLLWPVRAASGIVFGFGILGLQWWARRTLLIVAGLDLARAFWILLVSRGSTRYIGLSGEITIVFAIAVIACLANQRASLAFERVSGK